MRNRVAREVALPSPHTTEPAGPHEAVQVGGCSEIQRISLKAGSMVIRRAAVTRCGSVFCEVGIPPPGPPCLVLHSAP